MKEEISKLTAEEEQMVITVYLTPESIAGTAKILNLKRKVVENVLKKHSIPQHSPEIIRQISLTKARQTCLKHYGVENPGQSGEIKNKIKQTCLEHYGVENPSQANDIKEKKKATCREHYGTDWATQSEEQKEKSKQTCKERYGVEYPGQSEICKEKAKQTCLKHYGVENPFQAEICKEKAMKTSLERYGTAYPNQSVEVKQKARQTCLDKYGAEYFLVSDYAREKIKQTNMEKYGTDNPIKCPEIRLKCRQTIIQKYGGFVIPKKHFKYGTDYFDSFPELCFFLYHLHNNIPVIREPIEFSFIFEDKTWHYYPDFAVNNQIYEIKGDQFLADDGTWWCPYNHNLDGLYRERYLCAIKNNVNILYSKDYKKYIDWFNAMGYKKDDFKYTRSEEQLDE